jgi:Flp pilus assembly protein TadG
VLLAPVLVVLMFMGFQAAMWNHARTEARVVAREAAVLVARDGASASAAQQAAASTLANDGILADVSVTVTVSGELVSVTVRGNAPGILRGTSRPVSVVAAVPLEGWVGL